MKVGLVLEGGAMRGLFTAGVLDVMMDEGIDIDGIIGVSAGALFGPNYFSKQRGRVIRYTIKYAGDIRYISMLNYVLTGNVVSKGFAYYKMSKKLDIFDDETFKKSGKDFTAVVTNVETGEPEYFKIDSAIEDMEILRASSAVPLASRIIKINGHKYLDGGISDSIPIDKMIEMGYDKIIVVLTQPLDYVKHPLDGKKIKLIKKRYKKYPNLIATMINRHENYNKAINKIKELEKSGRVFVIRPSESINVNLIERDTEKLMDVYSLGIKECKNNINALKDYLKSSVE